LTVLSPHLPLVRSSCSPLPLGFSLLSHRPPPRGSSLFPYTTLFRSPAFRVGSVLPESVTFTSLITMRVTTSLSAFTGSVLRIVIDRKSTRLNSSHQIISYAVFCLKKKKTNKHHYFQDSLAAYKRSNV